MVGLSFFFNDTATTEIYTLSLHDALPIFGVLLVPYFIICPKAGREHGSSLVHRQVVEGSSGKTALPSIIGCVSLFVSGGDAF